MSILQSLIEKNNEQFKGSATNSSTLTNNLVVVYTRNEGEIFYGHRLDTKEEVSVTLGKYDKPEKSEFDRPSISEICGRSGVIEGGVVVFERAVQQDDGSWISRWPRVITKFPAGHAKFDTKAAIAKTRMYIGQNKKGAKYIQFKSIFPNTAQQVSSMEMVQTMSYRALVPTLGGVSPFLTFIIRDGASKVSFDMRPSMIEVDDGYGNNIKKVNPDTEATFMNFLESKHGNLLSTCLESGLDVRCVVGSTIYAGSKTKDNTLKKSAVVEFYKNEFTLDKEAEYSMDNCGYKDMVLGIKEEDGVKYITHFHSISPYDLPVAEKDTF